MRVYAFEVITNFLFSTGFQLLKLCWLRSERRGHPNAAMKTLDSKFHLQFILVITVGRKTSLSSHFKIYFFFLFIQPAPHPPANFKKTTSLTAVFLMDFFVFSVFCSLTTLYFWPYSAMLFLFVRQQLLLMSRPWSLYLSVLCLRRKLDR